MQNLTWSQFIRKNPQYTVPNNVHQLHVQQPSTYEKPEAASAVLGSWWWVVSPETCWASYKYGIITFWYIVASCWIFLCELYYDARIHERQVDIKPFMPMIQFCQMQTTYRVNTVPIVIFSNKIQIHHMTTHWSHSKMNCFTVKWASPFMNWAWAVET